MTEPKSVAFAELDIRLFGPFTVRLGGGAPLPRLRTRKGRALLALLTLRAGRDVERGWLAGMLWPDSDQAQSLYNLRRSLSDLRRALGSAARRLCLTTPHTLCLDLKGGGESAFAVADVPAFDAAVARGDPAALETAVGLYCGPLLEGWTDEWVFEERERACLDALESLAAHAHDHDRLAEAERHLRRATFLDPLRETARRALMRVLAAEGNYAAALHAFRDLRLFLQREMNADPAPETAVLFQQIRDEARRCAERPIGAKHP